MRISSNQLVSDLNRYGVHFAGELNRFPAIAPSLYNHFIRGYFDGDGGLFRSNEGFLRALALL